MSTLLTLASASSSNAGCMARSTRPALLARPSTPTLSKWSTRSKVLGRQDHPREPDRHPRKHTWLWDSRRERRQLRRIVWGINRKLWGHVRCHIRIGEVPGRNDSVDAGVDASNATILHGARATAPPGIYTSQQQQRGRHGAARPPSTGSRRNPAPMAYHQPGGFPGGQRPLQPPTPFKTFENWNYCHTLGGDVNNTHTGMTCRHPGLLHNPNATRTNMMGGNTAGLHRRILPSASGCMPPAPCRP
jgi:hypothetical protein